MKHRSPTFLDPETAAEALGMSTYELRVMLLREAGRRLEESGRQVAGGWPEVDFARIQTLLDAAAEIEDAALLTP